MKAEEQLIQRISELYKPYTSERDRLNELEGQVAYLKKTVKGLADFCQTQASMNKDLVQILKLMK